DVAAARIHPYATVELDLAVVAGNDASRFRGPFTGLRIIRAAIDPDAPKIAVLQVDFVPRVIYADGTENRRCVEKFADRRAIHIHGVGILSVYRRRVKRRKQIL